MNLIEGSLQETYFHLSHNCSGAICSGDNAFKMYERYASDQAHQLKKKYDKGAKLHFSGTEGNFIDTYINN